MNPPPPSETFNVITAENVLFGGTYDACVLYSLECSDKVTSIARTADIDEAREWLKNFGKYKV